MGNYSPNQGPERRSIDSVFREAENEHYLDCPNADFFVRCAAGVLDLILVYLLITGFENVSKVFWNLRETFLGTIKIPMLQSVFQYFLLVSRCCLIYAYFVWAVVNYRATAGKLLLGLRIIDKKSGGPLTFGQVLLREPVGKALSALTFGLGFLMVIVRKDRAALHDLLSKTVVKKVLGDFNRPYRS